MSTQKTTSYYLKCLLVVVIIFGFKYIPAPAPMTALGMNIIGIYAGAVVGWCTVGFIWPSILALIALGFAGATTAAGPLTVQGAFSSAFGNPTILFIFFLFIIAAIVEEAGLTKRLSTYLITRDFVKGRPWALSTMIIIGAFIGGCISLVPAILIGWAIVYNISEQVGFKKGDKWPAVMVFAVAWASTLGVCYLPFQIGVAASYGFLAKASGGTIAGVNYLSFLEFSTIYAILSLVILVVLCKYVFRPDMALFKTINVNIETEKGFSTEQKLTLGLLIILVVVLMAPSFLPKGFFLRTIVESLGTAGSTALVVGLGCLVLIKGKSLLDIQKMVAKGVSWNIIFMLATAFALAGVLTSKDSGVVPYIAQILSPLLSGNGPIIFVLLVSVISVIGAHLINHIVVSSVMIPVAFVFCQATGVNPVALVALLIFLIDFGLVLPSSSPTGAMLHGNKEWIPVSLTVKYGLLASAVMLVLTLVLGLPLANMIF